MRTQFDKTRSKLIDECIETLKKLDCCEVEFLPADAKDYHDALIRFSGPWGEIKYVIEAKQSFSGPKAAILIHKLSAVKSQDLPILLFADYVPEELAEDLRRNKIEFVDSAGNAYLNRPPLYVLVTGRKRVRAQESPTLAFQATGLKLVFLLLKMPKATGWKYRELADASGIGLASIGRVMKDLRRLGFWRLMGRHQRRLINRTDLLDRWELGYAERLRPKLLQNSYRLAENKPVDQLIDNIVSTLEMDIALIGGELGAALLMDTLRPERATLHLFGDPRKITTQLRLIPDPNGPVDVLNRFGNFDHWEEDEPRGCMLADPLLIHAELLLHRSDRLRRIADNIHENYILERIGANDQPR